MKNSQYKNIMHLISFFLKRKYMLEKHWERSVRKCLQTEVMFLLAYCVHSPQGQYCPQVGKKWLLRKKKTQTPKQTKTPQLF